MGNCLNVVVELKVEIHSHPYNVALVDKTSIDKTSIYVTQMSCTYTLRTTSKVYSVTEIAISSRCSICYRLSCPYR